jgi:hypothetical protein
MRRHSQPTLFLLLALLAAQGLRFIASADAITINDDAMLHAVEILHDVATGAADYKFLPPQRVRSGRGTTRLARTSRSSAIATRPSTTT